VNENVQPDPVARAAVVADEVLFPAAMQVDEADMIPKSHLDLLAAEGLYGLAGPVECGGLGLDMAQACTIIEQLASGCLSTTFVWFQHHSTVVTLRYGPNARLRERWLPRLCSGAVRGGIAVNSVRSEPGGVRARRTDDGYVLAGTAPFVSGWGMIDLLRVAARDEHGDVVYCLMDPIETATLQASRIDLVAGRASNTVRLDFRDHLVPEERIIGVDPAGGSEGFDTRASRFVGSLALGVALRCAQMAGQPRLLDEIEARRSQLDTADDETMPVARAAAAEFAVRAAAALVTATGSQSVVAGAHAGRLVREAMLLLVFASRPAIRDALQKKLAGTG
jgi:alkylation response protein AidB-like acyl-CoA dehydrogenase